MIEVGTLHPPLHSIADPSFRIRSNLPITVSFFPHLIIPSFFLIFTPHFPTPSYFTLSLCLCSVCQCTPSLSLCVCVCLHCALSLTFSLRLLSLSLLQNLPRVWPCHAMPCRNREEEDSLTGSSSSRQGFRDSPDASAHHLLLLAMAAVPGSRRAPLNCSQSSDGSPAAA